MIKPSLNWTRDLTGNQWSDIKGYSRNGGYESQFGTIYFVPPEGASFVYVYLFCKWGHNGWQAMPRYTGIKTFKCKTACNKVTTVKHSVTQLSTGKDSKT